MTRSLNDCCCSNTTMRSICIVVQLNLAVKNIKALSVAIEKQEWITFAPLSSSKMFRTAVSQYECSQAFM